MQTNQEGFTLIEVLVVVAVIGLLSSAILVGLGDVRKDARDTRRVSDIRQIQNSLEIYYSQHQFYPADIYKDLPGTPSDPLPQPTTGNILSYGYEKIDNNSYKLGACLEGKRPTGIAHISEDLKNSLVNYGSCNCTEKEAKAYCVKS